MKTINEIWKDVVGYEGRYQVSNKGRVRNCKNKILRRRVGSNGYDSVILSDDSNKRKSLLVHRLVLMAFTTNPLNKPCCNHKDSDRVNNHIGNLEWVTYSENTLHGRRLGRYPDQRGELAYNAKLTNTQAVLIRILYNTGKWTQKRIGREFGVTRHAIGLVTRKDTFRHI